MAKNEVKDLVEEDDVDLGTADESGKRRFTRGEDTQIFKLHKEKKSWEAIATALGNGRTEHGVSYRYYRVIKKAVKAARLAGKGKLSDALNLIKYAE